jgi:hypothetical protein
MEQIIKQISKISLSTFIVLLLLVVPFGNVVFGQVNVDADGNVNLSGQNAQGAGSQGISTGREGSFGDGRSQDGAGELVKEGTSCLASAGLSSLISGAVGNLVSGFLGTEVPVADGAIRAKETGFLGFSLDSLTFCVTNTLIDYITQSTINWAKSGFEGSPVFIEDPENFLRTIGDIEAGKFITEITGSSLFCEPFKPQIRVNLAFHQSGGVRAENVCTLSDRVDNIENFVNGVEEGDFEDFFSLTTNTYNNPNTSYLAAHEELKVRVSQKQQQAQVELDWGNGFLSFKDDEGNITTPGSLIENQLNNRLGGSQRRIEMADEFDELITVLVSEVLKLAINEFLE